MEFNKNEIAEIIATTVESTIQALIEKGVFANATQSNVGNTPKSNIGERSAYAQVESLRFNYRGFQKRLLEKQQEIDDLRQYGVPEKGGAVKQYMGNSGGIPQGMVLDQERVDNAVKKVEDSMQPLLEAISLVDKALEALQHDTYLPIITMRYFDGRTQEDIAAEMSCTQPNIAYHRKRLVRELTLFIFPDKVANECMA